MIDLKALREAAEKATMKWGRQSDNEKEIQNDAAFIFLASPSTVLALCRIAEAAIECKRSMDEDSFECPVCASDFGIKDCDMYDTIRKALAELEKGGGHDG
jgi:hypothetical protein